MSYSFEPAANATADGGNFISMLPHAQFRVALPLDGARARAHHSKLLRLLEWLSLETALWAACGMLAAYLLV